MSTEKFPDGYVEIQPTDESGNLIDPAKSGGGKSGKPTGAAATQKKE